MVARPQSAAAYACACRRSPEWASGGRCSSPCGSRQRAVLERLTIQSPLVQLATQERTSTPGGGAGLSPQQPPEDRVEGHTCPMAKVLPAIQERREKKHPRILRHAEQEEGEGLHAETAGHHLFTTHGVGHDGPCKARQDTAQVLEMLMPICSP